jgi:carbon-monoxide dehydrogenase small subunit
VTAWPLTLTINGERYDLTIEPHRTLLDVLRSDLGLTGTKENCLEAECGVCTVLLDRRAVNACILLAAECDGHHVLTIEGLGRDGRAHALQRAFAEHGAVQCGYCIPAMILSAKAFLDERAEQTDARGRAALEPTEAEVREALSGTLCRCTGYQKIVDAVLAAARALEAGR